MPFAGDALEGLRCPIFKRDARPRHQILDCSRHEDLAAARDRSDTSADVYRDAAELVTHDLALAGMEPGPDFQTQTPHGAHDRTRAPNRAGGTVKSRQEAVARRIDLPAAELRKVLADDTVMTIEEIT